MKKIKNSAAPAPVPFAGVLIMGNSNSGKTALATQFRYISLAETQAQEADISSHPASSPRPHRPRFGSKAQTHPKRDILQPRQENVNDQNKHAKKLKIKLTNLDREQTARRIREVLLQLTHKVIKMLKATSNNNKLLETCSQINLFIDKTMKLPYDERYCLTEEIIRALQIVWQNKEFLDVFHAPDHRAAFQEDNFVYADYFVDKYILSQKTSMERHGHNKGKPVLIAANNKFFEPDLNDKLRIFKRGSAFSVDSIRYNEVVLHVADSPGATQQNWETFFEVTPSLMAKETPLAIAFLVPIGEYDNKSTYLSAAKTQLHESLITLEKLNEAEFLKKLKATKRVLNFYLVLSKIDMFGQKFSKEKIPLSESGLQDNQHIVNLDALSEDEAIEWIIAKFLTANILFADCIKVYKLNLLEQFDAEPIFRGCSDSFADFFTAGETL